VFYIFLNGLWTFAIKLTTLFCDLKILDKLECLEMTCLFMVVMPWYLLYITRPFQPYLLLFFSPLSSWWTKLYLLNFRIIYSNRKIIEFKEAHVLVQWKGSQNFWFTYNWRSCCHICVFTTCRTSSSSFISPTNSLINLDLTPLFPITSLVTFASSKSIVD